jgi:hypothetical protein
MKAELEAITVSSCHLFEFGHPAGRAVTRRHPVRPSPAPAATWRPTPTLRGGCRVLGDHDRVHPLKALAPTKREFRAVLPRRRNRCLIGAPL